MTKEEPKYFNRELSWLEFNQRVLDEARDESVPVLDRLKFLAITASNLDEFFMIRVGGLQTLAARGSQKPDPSGLTPAVQLDAISKRTHQMTVDQYACFLGELEPALAAGGIQRVGPRDVNEQQMAFWSRFSRTRYFQSSPRWPSPPPRIFPSLPIAR